jgi:TrmH family RNA methyltransferase
MSEIQKISSRKNMRLIHARKVRDGKAREQIFIEGKRLAVEALRSRVIIDECFIVDGFAEVPLIDAVADRSARLYQISGKLFASLADTVDPQGIVLIARRPETGQDCIGFEPGKTNLRVIVFLEEINNPANLGAVLRTAEAAGVDGVVISKSSADAFSPKSLRAGMGSSLRLPIWENADFPHVIQWAKTLGMTVIAADIKATQDYNKTDWKRPILLIFGSEAHGLSERQIEMAEELVRIPMQPPVESLNLAVSAGIILFEAKRQR